MKKTTFLGNLTQDFTHQMLRYQKKLITVQYEMLFSLLKLLLIFDYVFLSFAAKMEICHLH